VEVRSRVVRDGGPSDLTPARDDNTDSAPGKLSKHGRPRSRSDAYRSAVQRGVSCMVQEWMDQVTALSGAHTQPPLCNSAGSSSAPPLDHGPAVSPITLLPELLREINTTQAPARMANSPVHSADISLQHHQDGTEGTPAAAHPIPTTSNDPVSTEEGKLFTKSGGPSSSDGEHSVMRITVYDSGCGISQHMLRRLFQQFTQGDAKSTRRHGGSGLGLVIVRRVVELMGGKLAVVSEPGRGSAFTVVIPLRVAPQGDDPGYTSPASVHRGSPLMRARSPTIHAAVKGFQWPRALLNEPRSASRPTTPALGMLSRTLSHGVSAAAAVGVEVPVGTPTIFPNAYRPSSTSPPPIEPAASAPGHQHSIAPRVLVVSSSEVIRRSLCEYSVLLLG